MKFRDELQNLGACHEAIAWVSERTLEQAWCECARPDWMLWLCGRLNIDTRRCAGLFALRVWHLVAPEAELSCAWAIDCALRGADAEEREAAYAAADAAYAATYAAADAPAYAAANAAAYAAYAANAAANAADAAYARSLEYCAQCDIIREEIPLSRVRAAWAKVAL